MNRNTLNALAIVGGAALGLLIVAAILFLADLGLEEQDTPSNYGSVPAEPSMFPPCPTEDSAWCTWVDGEDTYLNLAPADPAPATLKVEVLP